MKYFLAITIFLVLTAILLVASPALADYNTVTFDANTNIDVHGTPIVSSGSMVEAMAIDNGTITFTMQTGSVVTLTSNSRALLTNSRGINTTCTASYSTIAFTTSTGAETLTVTPGSTCGAGSGETGGGGSVAGDITPPSISNVVAQPSSYGATITWQTSEGSLTWVVYGTSTTYGKESKGTTYVSSHSVTLTGLFASTTYHYQVKSKDSAGNQSVTLDKTFATLVAPAVPTVTATAEITVSAATSGVAQATTDQGTTAKVDVPAGAVTANTQVTVTPTQTTVANVATQVAAIPSGENIVGGYVYDYKAVSGTTTVSSFAKNVTVTMTYTDSQVSGLDEESLKISYYDTALAKWVAVTSTIDKATNTVTASISHFTLFALIGKPAPVVVTPATTTVPTTPTTPVVKPISQMTVAELKAEIAKIAALILQLQAQFLELFGSPATIQGIPAGSSFTKALKLGMSDNEVKYLQIVLNSDPATRVALSGVGSPGKETSYFGALTKAAVIKFQEKYASEILTPAGLTKGTGLVGSSTRTKLNKMLGR